MLNIAKAAGLVADHLDENGIINVILTEVKSIDIYGNLYVIKGVQRAYHVHFIVDVARNLVFQPHPAAGLIEEEMIGMALEEWK